MSQSPCSKGHFAILALGTIKSSVLNVAQGNLFPLLKSSKSVFEVDVTAAFCLYEPESF
jgi:hypothetical protein